VKRRKFITLLGGAAMWPLAARAQAKQMRRIAVLMGLVANDPEAQSRVAAFENGLRELGWVNGRNLAIEYRWAGDGNVLRDHLAELLAMAPDVILANSTPVTVVLREQSGAVPIVFTQVTDPVGQGLVPNLAHPGGNVTGFTSFVEAERLAGFEVGASATGRSEGFRTLTLAYASIFPRVPGLAGLR
jgi:putative tryptophan/tyrosine transport system substrate-binding protein